MNNPYKEMYLTLFRETTRVIEQLKEAQQKAEEQFLSFDSGDKILYIGNITDPSVEQTDIETNHSGD